jgi:hypothetical protein
MAVYHQMGHHSNNLIDLPEMSVYAGAIFSPINCTQASVGEQIASVREARPAFETLLDPQLYVPSAQRGELRKWNYFPKDFDTADQTSNKWWDAVNKKLADASAALAVDGVCSPAVIPRVFNDDYYLRCLAICNSLVNAGHRHKLAVMQTLLVNLADLSVGSRPLEVASIVSQTKSQRVYLLLHSGEAIPRRELTDANELSGAMRLIRALEQADLRVTVGFCSSDLLLWKAAGASNCASGKFFNLRRFTRQRFEEQLEGGGQLPYWFEEALLAFLRQGDLLRARREGLLSEASSRNPFAQEILGLLDEAARSRTKVRAWQALSWRQFLYSFADIEQRVAKGSDSAENLLVRADATWKRLDEAKILMEERHNDGSWVRIWLNALHEFLSEE